jgi:hypothetical protein
LFTVGEAAFFTEIVSGRDPKRLVLGNSLPLFTETQTRVLQSDRGDDASKALPASCDYLISLKGNYRYNIQAFKRHQKGFI